VTDFGLSKIFDYDMSTITREPGTKLFMAPETQDTSYGLEIDIWSFGVLCSQILVGCLDLVNTSPIPESILDSMFCETSNEYYTRIKEEIGNRSLQFYAKVKYEVFLPMICLITFIKALLCIPDQYAWITPTIQVCFGCYSLTYIELFISGSSWTTILASYHFTALTAH
jgi:serine/threonine protein kinase